MPQAKPILGENIEGGMFSFDLPTLVDTRLLIEANSGGGKSFAIRKLLEVSFGQVQQIILDVEGEFASLREKYDYVLAGKDGETPADPRTADVLCKRILELGASLIVDLYELEAQQRKRYVRIFLESMINAPKDLWHPVLVVVDEAHVMAPERGESEAMGAVIDLATRGRKRGYACLLATQRLSKLHKDAAAECNNLLIGRTGLDVDMKRASELLGFTSKEQMLSLRELEPGEFFAFGPAFAKGITKIKVGKVETSHPKAGARMLGVVPPAPERIRALLPKLEDIPQVKEKQLKEKEDFLSEIRSLRGQLAAAKRPDAIDSDKLNQLKDQAFQRGQSAGEHASKIEIAKLESILKQYKKALEEISIRSAQAAKIEVPKFEHTPTPTPFVSKPIIIAARVPEIKTLSSYSEDSEKESRPLRDGAMRMLKAVAQLNEMGRHASRNQIGTLAGFSTGGGTFSTYITELKTRGWIIERNSEDISITDMGLKNAGEIKPLATDRDSLLSMWKSKFRDGAAKMLQVLADHYPDSIPREQLGEESGFSSGGGTFSTYVSELKRNNLAIEEKGVGVRASPFLFLEE